MDEVVVNLALVILASVYFGIIIGRQGNRKAIEKKVQDIARKVKEEAKQEQQDLAVDLHTELYRIRESIVDSAHAYQSAVKAVGDKLVPFEEVAGLLNNVSQHQLPLILDEDIDSGKESRVLSAEGNDAESERPTIELEAVVSDSVDDEASSIEAEEAKSEREQRSL